MQTQLTLQATMTQRLMPQMIQHLNLLQLTTMELGELIQKKSLENPLIDMVESTIEKPYDWLNLAFEKGPTAKMDYDLVFPQTNSPRDFLIEQIPLTTQEDEKLILEYLIDSLDERLFLTVTAEEICNKFNVSLLKAQNLIEILQSFEPVGVGVGNVTQFLLMQINLKCEVPRFAKEFVIHEIKAMAKMDILNLSKRYSISVSEVLQTIDFIKELPRTTTNSIVENAPFIVPDASVYKIDGDWIIKLEDRALPSVRLNDLYVEILKSVEKDYLQHCMRDYVTLVQGIDFRKKTLYAIIDYLVVNQLHFFERGIKALKPMGLRDVAQALNLHESTISRAIKGKYLYTKFGNIALQDLFVKSVGNSTTSSIFEDIANLINNEPKNAPYSDQQIAILLQQKGIQISRRTVAKYREQLNIPSSQKRAHLLIVK